MYLDKAKKRFPEVLSELNLTGKVVPSKPQQLEEMEKKLGLPLPYAYKEYLLWMGNGGGSLMGDMYVPGNIEFAREDAMELMSFDNYPQSLPKDAIVFTMHGGYHFRFFRSKDGDNPTIHQYYEGQGIEWNQFSSLEAYLLKYMEEQVEILRNARQWKKNCRY